MPVVTGVLERHGRAKIFVDDEFWAELDAQVAAEHGLFEGAMLSDAGLAEARVAGEKPLAMNRALGILSYRARAKGELRKRLVRAGYAEETVGAVVVRLEELGYLDDEEFARNLAREEARKKYGPRRILGDLRRAGVDEEVARETVEEEFAERSEYETALAIARQRYNTGEGSDAQARRVYGFLMRRGYSSGVCAEVARKYRQETDG
ncbi:MAG: recombination regulator RecX [Actinomycetota bacterium]|nr:recombination regulator RecX [Actinomycetota bacterium]